jgi:hypothetical protein
MPPYLNDAREDRRISPKIWRNAHRAALERSLQGIFSFFFSNFHFSTALHRPSLPQCQSNRSGTPIRRMVNLWRGSCYHSGSIVEEQILYVEIASKASPSGFSSYTDYVV